jgi:mRNA interferase MazF
MDYKRGDVALVYFPHSDLRTIKLRPVLVVQADDLNTGIPQLVVAMISSNLRRAGHPSRVTVLLSDTVAVGTGLQLDSVIMTDNLATIETTQFKSRLGIFSNMPAVDNALYQTLGLKPSTPPQA